MELIDIRSLNLADDVEEVVAQMHTDADRGARGKVVLAHGLTAIVAELDLIRREIIKARQYYEREPA